LTLYTEGEPLDDAKFANSLYVPPEGRPEEPGALAA